MPAQPTLDITAITSMGIAVLALFATLWQGKLARDHNRKSTTPILAFHGSQVSGHQVAFRNDGVGPAILIDFHCFVDGKQCKSMKEVDALLRVPESIEYFRAEVNVPASVGVGQSIDLLRLSGDVTVDILMAGLVARLDFRVTYKSVYGEIFAASLK